MMLASLITSKTRIKLLLKFFLNPGNRAYLRGLAEELNESTNAVRIELNRLAEANLLHTATQGRTKVYGANREHPLFPEIHNLVRKTLGIDKVIDQVVAKLGSVELAFITGDYAHGRDSGLIDIVIVGMINDAYLRRLIAKVEALIGRKMRALVLDSTEFARLREKLDVDDALILWHNGLPCTTMAGQDARLEEDLRSLGRTAPRAGKLS